MEIDLARVVTALKHGLERNGSSDTVVAEIDVDPNEGDTYRLIGNLYVDPHRGHIFRIDPRSNLFSDYPNGFALYEVSDIQTVSSDDITLTVRVGKIGEAVKRRVRVAPAETSGAALRAIYEALRTLDSTVPEFGSLSEAKRKIFASQIATLRLTMKM